MKSIDSHGEMLREINVFVSALDPSVRHEAFKFLLAEEQKITPRASAGANSSQVSTSGRNLSPQELIRKCKISSSMDTALVLAYWLEEDQKKESFTSLDLKKAFSDAREPGPGNRWSVIVLLRLLGGMQQATAYTQIAA
jgi:hypothetical protein